MDLFAASAKHAVGGTCALAVRMRPRSLDEFVGQRNVVGDDSVLRRIFEGKLLTSLILYGPPGTGKTTLAHLLCRARPSPTLSRSTPSPQASPISGGPLRRRPAPKLTTDRPPSFSSTKFIDLVAPNRTHSCRRSKTARSCSSARRRKILDFSVNVPLLSRACIVRLEPLGRDDVRAIVGPGAFGPEKRSGRAEGYASATTPRSFCSISVTVTPGRIERVELAALAAAQQGDPVS